MGLANGYFFRAPDSREGAFLEHIQFGEVFGEPVQDFAHSRRVPLVCFIVSRAGVITHIAQGKRGVKSGTGLRRLNISDAEPIEPAIKLEEVLPHVEGRQRNRVKERFSTSAVLTPNSFRAFVNGLLKARPELRPLLDRYSAAFEKRVQQIPEKARESLGYQKQAVLTALEIAKDSRVPVDEWREAVQGWQPPTDGQPKSFLDGLSTARVREDPMVVQDLTNLPGFDLIKTMPFGAAVFESHTARVTIVLANRLPLEQQLGVDLIYFNETFRCFVMVQYKAMEKESQKDIYRLPNEQLEKELLRMEQVSAELSSCTNDETCDGFRLTENPFFLKLCSRIVFNPDDVALVDGMYIPLGYWRRLEKDARIQGAGGGKGVRYENVGRYFDNGAFIGLVANAWIGSTPEQSLLLEKVIRATVESGKAVVVAIKSELNASMPQCLNANS